MFCFKNALNPETIPTYEGSNQATHPSVLYFPEGWHGFCYWMAMTPYPRNNNGYEDPSILASQDGRTWQVPPGAVNPLVLRPAQGHNCDVELCYRAEEDELWIYYVEADDVKQSWVKLLRSKDGSHWEEPQIVLHDPEQMYSILSPSIQRRADGKWQMWYVDTGDVGYINQNNRVRTCCSEDGLVWDEASDCDSLKQPGYQIWHLTVWRDPKTDVLHAFYPAYPDATNCDYCSLFYARKEPGAPWQIYSHPVLTPGPEGAWDDFCIYRSAFLLDEEGDKLQLWYSGKKKSDASWNIGLIEGRYSKMLEGLRKVNEVNR